MAPSRGHAGQALRIVPVAQPVTTIRTDYGRPVAGTRRGFPAPLEGEGLAHDDQGARSGAYRSGYRLRTRSMRRRRGRVPQRLGAVGRQLRGQHGRTRGDPDRPTGATDPGTGRTAALAINAPNARG